MDWFLLHGHLTMASKRLQGSLVLNTVTTGLVLCMLLLILSEKKLRNHQPCKNIAPLDLRIITETKFSTKNKNGNTHFFIHENPNYKVINAEHMVHMFHEVYVVLFSDSMSLLLA